MTSFIQRRLKVKITLGATAFRDGSNIMEISNARMMVEYKVYNSGMPEANITIFGMHPDNMNAMLTIKGYDKSGSTWTKPNWIQIFVIDESGNELQVYEGQIFEAIVDYNSAPNVPIRIASRLLVSQTEGASNNPDQKNNQKLDGHSLRGAQKVEDIAKEIIARYNESHKDEKRHRLVNDGVDKSITDYAIAGASLQDELNALKQTSNIEWHFKSTDKEVEVHINPPNMAVQNKDEIILSKDTGMIGYPVLVNNGCNVKALYTPFYAIGNIIRIKSQTVRFARISTSGDDAVFEYALPEMTYKINQMVHRISSEMPGGPWETEFMLNNFLPADNEK